MPADELLTVEVPVDGIPVTGFAAVLRVDGNVMPPDPGSCLPFLLLVLLFWRWYTAIPLVSSSSPMDVTASRSPMAASMSLLFDLRYFSEAERCRRRTGTPHDLHLLPVHNQIF